MNKTHHSDIKDWKDTARRIRKEANLDYIWFTIITAFLGCVYFTYQIITL